MHINECTLTDSSPIHITLKEVGDYISEVIVADCSAHCNNQKLDVDHLVCCAGYK